MAKDQQQMPDETNEEYAMRLAGYKQGDVLLARAWSLGIKAKHGMTNDELREAIKEKIGVLNATLMEKLADAGIVPGVTVVLRSRKVKINEIYVAQRRRDSEVRVTYWVVDWDRPNNRGRASSASANDMLYHAELVK